MRKLLLGTAAVALGMTFVAAEASAEVKLEVGGHTKLYASWLDQDTTSDDPATAAVNESEDERAFDILRETEVQFSGETTLDNGLTVGAHIEADIDGNGAGDEFNTEEAYAYFSGAWGRVNFGAEDGAAYLLQVAAPSADSNFDGIRQYVDPVDTAILKLPGAQAVVGGVNAPVAGAFGDNFTLDDLFAGFVVDDVVVDVNGSNTSTGSDILVGANGVGALLDSRFDYDQAISDTDDKLTYMTPVFNGFQAGVSYTPELGAFRDLANNDDDDVFGANNPGAGFGDAEWGDVFDVAARYEGMLGEVGVALGAGWTHASLEADDGAPVFYQSADGVIGFAAATDVVVATLDDREAWNVGVDFDWGPFGLGGSYSEDDNGVSGDNLQSETWVVGVDYTTGPFKLGATYYNRDQDIASAELETDRWTGGVVYTYGPGMTFRGSVSYIEFEEDVGFENADADATSVLLGTQINF